MLSTSLIGRQSILRQFLNPILLAVLITGLGVAGVSKWAADRASLQESNDRMRSIGEVIAQTPFPKTLPVLEKLKNLTSLDFAYFQREDLSKPWNVYAATLSLSDQEIAAIRDSVAHSVTEGAAVRSESARNSGAIEFTMSEGMLGGQWMRYLHLPADSGWLVVLESESSRGDGWYVLALPLITGVVSSIGIAVVATWTASRLSTRIERLRREVSEIASGHFVKRELLGPDDDVRTLQATIHRMGEQLEESRKQIAQNERSRLIHMLGSGLAHELRNHLTGARLALQTMEVTGDNAESTWIALKQLDLAETQIRRLLAVRSQPDKNDLESMPMPLEEVVNTVIELVRPVASHRDVTLDVFSPDAPEGETSGTIPPLQVLAGQSMISVILNLLMNAMEAVGTAGVVQLQLRVDRPNRLLLWSVRDNGPGPAPEIAATMFEPFATTKREGVGLGLAMCKQVIESIGGKIEWHRHDSWTQFEVVTPIEIE